MYKAKDVISFVKKEVLPLLPKDYSIHSNKSLLRLRANFVQSLTVYISKGGWIHVSPVLYVLGADNSEEIITASAGIANKKPYDWSFPPDSPLDHEFAKMIVEHIEKTSPISFLNPLEDVKMVKALKTFDQSHPAILSFIAYLCLCMGDASANRFLIKLEKYYKKICNPAKPSIRVIRDWEYKRQARSKTLIVRMRQSDCVTLCRQEAEAHATNLGLHKLAWPDEWPLQLMQSPKSILNILLDKFV